MKDAQYSNDQNTIINTFIAKFPRLLPTVAIGFELFSGFENNTIIIPNNPTIIKHR